MEKNGKLSHGAVDALREVRDIGNLICEEAQVRIEGESMFTDSQLFHVLNGYLERIQGHVKDFERHQAPDRFVRTCVYGGRWERTFPPA